MNALLSQILVVYLSSIVLVNTGEIEKNIQYDVEVLPQITDFYSVQTEYNIRSKFDCIHLMILYGLTIFGFKDGRCEMGLVHSFGSLTNTEYYQLTTPTIEGYR